MAHRERGGMLISSFYCIFFYSHWMQCSSWTIFEPVYALEPQPQLHIEAIITEACIIWLTLNCVWNDVYDTDDYSDKDAESYPPYRLNWWAHSMVPTGDGLYRSSYTISKTHSRTHVRRCRRCVWEFFTMLHSHSINAIPRTTYIGSIRCNLSGGNRRRLPWLSIYFRAFIYI